MEEIESSPNLSVTKQFAFADGISQKQDEEKRNENWAPQSLQKECWRNNKILHSFENFTQQQKFFFAYYPVLWNRENSLEEKSANTSWHGMAALKDYLKPLDKEMCLCKILTPFKVSFFF